MDERKTIHVSTEDHVTIMAIDRPRGNEIDLQVLSDLESAVDDFLRDPSCRVGIITSANPAIFSLGADIAAFNELAATGDIMEYVLKGQQIYKRILQSSKPFIAAVHGMAAGGALELVLACHMRVLAERASLVFPEVSLGIMPGWGGTQVLPRMVGRAKAIELILLGENISAQEAFRLNLANKVVPRGDVLPAAKQLAAKIAAKSSLACRAAMGAILAGGEMDLEEGFAYEADRLASLLATEDAQEGVQAFLEKRQPVYKGR